MEIGKNLAEAIEISALILGFALVMWAMTRR